MTTGEKPPSRWRMLGAVARRHPYFSAAAAGLLLIALCQLIFHESERTVTGMCFEVRNSRDGSTDLWVREESGREVLCGFKGRPEFNVVLGDTVKIRGETLGGTILLKCRFVERPR